jgi:hypothetical protein
VVPKDSWHYWFLLAALPTVSRRLLGIAPQAFDECKVEDQGKMPRSAYDRDFARFGDPERSRIRRDEGVELERLLVI